MAPLYAARDFRVNVLRRIQFIQLGGFLLAFLLSGLTFPVENIPDVLVRGSGGGRGVRAAPGARVHRDAAGWI